MAQISTVRHEEIFSAKNNDLTISIVGAGAIGSRVFSALAELGLTQITTYDFDIVASHNLANQLYLTGDIDSPKVEALKQWYLYKVGVTKKDLPIGMNFINNAVDSKTELKGTVFLLVDSMEARKKIYEENIKDNINITQIIDVRMASTHGNIMCFDPYTQGDQWLNTLINDDDAETSACGSSLTVGTTASILSNMAVWQYMHSLTNPEAGDDKIELYLKPLCISTESWIKSNDSEEQA